MADAEFFITPCTRNAQVNYYMTYKKAKNVYLCAAEKYKVLRRNGLDEEACKIISSLSNNKSKYFIDVPVPLLEILDEKLTELCRKLPLDTLKL